MQRGSTATRLCDSGRQAKFFASSRRTAYDPACCQPVHTILGAVGGNEAFGAKQQVRSIE